MGALMNNELLVKACDVLDFLEIGFPTNMADDQIDMETMIETMIQALLIARCYVSPDITDRHGKRLFKSISYDKKQQFEKRFCADGETAEIFTENLLLSVVNDAIKNGLYTLPTKEQMQDFKAFGEFFDQANHTQIKDFILFAENNDVRTAIDKAMNPPYKKSVTHKTTRAFNQADRRNIKKDLNDTGIAEIGDVLLKIKSYMKFPLSVKLLLLRGLIELEVTGNKTIHIPLDEYAQMTGYNINPHDDTETERKKAVDRKKNFRKRIRTDLDILYNSEFEYENYKKQLVDARIIQEKGKLNAYDDEIIMRFADTFAEPLLSSNVLTWIHPNIFKIDEDHITAYYIAIKLCHHYSTINNHTTGTKNRLSMDTLIKAANLPTYDKIKLKNNRNWRRIIQEPIMKALDYLVNIGILKEYTITRSKGEPLKDDDYLYDATYKDFSNLYVNFTLTDYEYIDAKIKESTKKRKTKKNKKKTKKTP